MRNIVSHRPSPAFVLAAIALLVALGGTSVAAVKDAAPNSVGSAQLKANAVTNPKIATGAVSSSKLANGAVTGGKIASRAVTGAKIAANAITTTQVAQGSLLSSDFGAGQIPRGPTGPAGFQGSPGTQGPPGLSGVQIVSASTSDSTDGVQFVTAACPSGKKVIGGGAQATGTAVASAPVSIRESNPTAAGTGWHAVAGSPFNFDTTPDAWNVTATAICANTT